MGVDVCRSSLFLCRTPAVTIAGSGLDAAASNAGIAPGAASLVCVHVLWLCGINVIPWACARARMWEGGGGLSLKA